MSPQEIKKLLGGYATGTLTAEEQQALFAAALEDQELFDALAREQSLRDLLRDPAARAELLSALDAPASRFGFWQWLRRPVVAGLATACVVAIAVIAVWQGTRVAPMKPAAHDRGGTKERTASHGATRRDPSAVNRPESRSSPAKVPKRSSQPPATPVPRADSRPGLAQRPSASNRRARRLCHLHGAQSRSRIGRVAQSVGTSGPFREPSASTRARSSTVTRWRRAPTPSCPRVAAGAGPHRHRPPRDTPLGPQRPLQVLPRTSRPPLYASACASASCAATAKQISPPRWIPARRSA